MSETVLVTGATGQQGGAVARALIAAGTSVRGLVRDPSSGRARALAELGVELVKGDLDEPESLKSALHGARGLFSIQLPDLVDPMGDAEIRQARNLAAAAAAAGVQQVVHTSASGVTRLVDESRWSAYMAHYCRAKSSAEDALREVGAASTTILRPSTFMENFLRPSFYFADFFGRGTADQLLVAYDLDVPQPFIAVADIAAAAAAAFADPAHFHCVELELAGERRTFREVTEILSAVWGIPITLPSKPANTVDDGLPEPFVVSQKYLSARPAPARPEFARAFGLPTTTVEEWARTTKP
jgi:uncharacterized protein YbjT (DUF2867 family)